MGTAMAPKKGASTTLANAYRQKKTAPAIQKPLVGERKTRQLKLFQDAESSSKPESVEETQPALHDDALERAEKPDAADRHETPEQIDEAEEAALKRFDLDITFGPCSSMSRAARFARAE